MVKYFIAIPAGPSMPTHTAISLSKLTDHLQERGIKYETSFEIGNCHVDDARNHLVYKFLASDCTDLVFIDSDIKFEPSAFIELVEHTEDVVGATYPFKNESGDFPCRFLKTSYPDDETGLVPIDGLPTGFLKISRSTFERLQPHMPTFNTADKQGVTEFFARTIRNGFEIVRQGTRVGGDIGFCYDVKKFCDIQCWLEPKIYLGHVGSKTWEGSFYWKQATWSKGVYPTFREMYQQGKWEKKQYLDEIITQWKNESHAGDADYLSACALLLEKHHDKPCLEMGSGLSTFFLALAAEKTGTNVVSYEQDRAWYGKTWGVLKDTNLTDYVQLVRADAENGAYDMDDFHKNNKYGLVCVDGPKCTVNSLGRRQATELDADVFLFDDGARSAILESVKVLEDRGYHSHVLGDNPIRPLIVCVRKEFTKEV